MTKFIKIGLKEIDSLRLSYLNSLTESQEIFLEFLIEESFCYKIIEYDQTLGYCIIFNSDTLVEFYLKDKYIQNSFTYFELLLDKFLISSIYCKSFDSLLLNSCLKKNLPYELTGLMYRDFYQIDTDKTISLEMKYADQNDLDFLLSQEDEVFEPKNQLAQFVESKSIIMVRCNSEIVGCGFISKIHNHFKYYDLGVWTKSNFRNKGIATQVIAHLKSECLDNLRIPVCGCEINNLGSISILRKNGFFSKHSLIKFTN